MCLKSKTFKKISTSILLLVTVNIFAQEFNCTVKIDSLDFVNMPHYGNNAFLYDIIDITENTTNHRKVSSKYISNDFFFNIPIKVWIYNNDNGTNAAISDEEVDNLIVEVNNYFNDNNTNIRFYRKCAYEHINRTEFNIINSNDEFNNMIRIYRDSKALNWHFVRNVNYPNANLNWGGIAKYPWRSFNFSFAVRYNINSLRMATNIVHEIGHTFGLIHTHDAERISESLNGDVEKECFQESVSRARRNWAENGCFSTHGKRKCEVNGDAICDTEASPRDLSDDLSFRRQNGVTFCTYTGTEQDLWGDTFTPPVYNFMSYTGPICRTVFTPSQIALMHFHIANGMADRETTVGPNKVRIVNITPWYNKNILSLSGSSNSGEIKTYTSPERIEVALEETFTVNPEATISLIARNRIRISPGFNAKNGSRFSAVTGNITNCNINAKNINNKTTDTHLNYISSNDELGLKIIELYENLKTSKKESVTNVVNNPFLIYPNPTSENLSIVFEKAKPNLTVVLKIYNMYGALLYEKTTNQTDQTLDLKHMASGTYVLTIQSADINASKKLVISNK